MRTSPWISKHFNWYEVEHSDTAERLDLDNIIPFELEGAAIITAQHMEDVRHCLDDNGIKVNSWYRGGGLQALPEFYNRSSRHPYAEAVDFVCLHFGTPVDICKRLIEQIQIINFDQLILEHTWVHISWKVASGEIQRNEVLTLLPGKKYAVGLTDRFGKLI